MVKTLTTHGNSSALIIEKPILELLNITPQTPLMVTTDGKNIIISPIQDERHAKRVKKALSKVNKQHAATLKALAR